MSATFEHGRVDVAEARLESEFGGLWRRLFDTARYGFRLPFEDCEEVVQDTLLAWYRELARGREIGCDRAYCATVLKKLESLDESKAASNAFTASTRN